MKCHIAAALTLLCPQCTGFSYPHHSKKSTRILNSFPLKASVQKQPITNVGFDQSISRRNLARGICSSLFTAGLFSVGITSNPSTSSADSSTSGATIWKTGKAPEVPGQKPKDKSDTKGTKKDPNFLRSIADCKGKCENSPGPDGLARSSAECLSACQDICCTTYEQCTFAIIARWRSGRVMHQILMLDWSKDSLFCCVHTKRFWGERNQVLSKNKYRRRVKLMLNWRLKLLGK